MKVCDRISILTFNSSGLMRKATSPKLNNIIFKRITIEAQINVTILRLVQLKRIVISKSILSNSCQYI